MAKNYTTDIIHELERSAQQIKTSDLDEIVHAIQTAHHIFLAGAGRSGLAIRAFGNRLLHLGYQISIVGEISSPHSASGDLLILCSGSGETDSLKSLAKKAKTAGLQLALLTTKAHSTIAQWADILVCLPGKSKSEQNTTMGFSQPMGSEFEQLAFLTFDGIVMDLMDVTGETSESMLARHADFE